MLCEIEIMQLNFDYRLARDLKLPQGIVQAPSKSQVRDNAAPSYQSVADSAQDEGESQGGLC